MKIHDRLYIGGAWVAPHGQGTIDADHPATEEPIARVPEGDSRDVDAAVAAARAAFDDWAATAPADRAAALRRIAEELGKRADRIAMAIATEVGMPLKLARRVQTDGPVANWAAYAKVAESFEFEKPVG
jgi:aldehyde dehydrogenase (NAD+)